MIDQNYPVNFQSVRDFDFKRVSLFYGSYGASDNKFPFIKK
ncbi:hypothetical protein B4135_3454 [Caldibacillus debilis]|uniref:Uncharacterized protein n=1 Tax=Caldibacillus debilis TaxID=301148 RepID=A0A150LE44_9BACI|nr:hypothetical protein B4135_3454 [Caldibacillus debilis]